MSETSPGEDAGGRDAAGEPAQLGFAWGVHFLTASGAVVGVLALLAAAAGELRASALWMLVALAIDSVDGTLARRARVAERIPGLDGRRLDDIVDYLNYVIVPAVFLVWAGVVDHWLWVAFPVLASAYGFSRADAKTEDYFFLGFPSYWNVVALYLWKLDVTGGAAAAWLVGLSIAVFVPLKYIYPSRTPTLHRTTNVGAIAWILVFSAAIAFPSAFAGFPILELTLLYPAYYIGASLWLGNQRGD